MPQAYAAQLQPYLVTGSLYLLLVPFHEVSELKARVDELVNRWLDYLQAGAPEAVVQLVLTHCDAKLRRDREWTMSYLETECKEQMAWLEDAVRRHQEAAEGERRLSIQPGVACVSSIAGGDASLRHLRSRLESVCSAKPPLLPCIGMSVPRTWLLAFSFLRAIRDGRMPLKAVQATLAAQETAGNELPDVAQEQRVAPRPYIPITQARAQWEAEVPTVLEAGALDEGVFDDALALLINQGEVFAAGGILFLQPDYVTRLVKPLVDHRLGFHRISEPIVTATPSAGGKPAGGGAPNAPDAPADGADGILGPLAPAAAEVSANEGVRTTPLVALTAAERHQLTVKGIQNLALQSLVKEGELREELLPLLWEPLGMHPDEYGEQLRLLCVSGVLCLLPPLPPAAPLLLSHA